LAAACLAIGTWLVAAPGPALGARDQVSIIQDDNLLWSGRADPTLAEFAGLGADWVHVIVRWDRVAPSPGSRRRPRFDAADPAAYPAASWARLDGIVAGAQAHGLQVLLTPSGPVPRWGSEGGRSRVWKPEPREFGSFVRALGIRYSGRYGGGEGTPPLPRVSRWSVWNEPNQPGWLQPQFVAGQPYSPHRYRELLRSAARGLRASGHGGDLLLLAETAPLGDRGTGTKSKMRPGRFLRELFCMGSGAPVCRRRFSRLPGGGLAHHPYVKYRSQTPTTRPGDRDDYPVGATRSLIALLDRAGRAGRIRRSMPVYVTEFGWQSNPPDRLFGVGLARQARYINESERLFYRLSRVRSTAQYLLRDDQSLAGFQTGLRFASGAPKPALDAWRLPLVVSRRGSRDSIWGLVRPAGRTTVILEAGSRPGGPFAPVGAPRRTDGSGVFFASEARRPYWRFSWTDAAGTRFFSRPARG
jgi:hypothetical protein